uniref:glutaminase n=2 Tax=Strongyloides stercoralis TaxID=6248 RepID=A0AAF5DQR6_STRER
MKPVLSNATVSHLANIIDSTTTPDTISQNKVKKTVNLLMDAYQRDEKSEEDLIYELFKIPSKNEASIGKLISVLKNYGLREDDPRLCQMMENIIKIEVEKEEKSMEMKDPKAWRMSEADFRLCIRPCIDIISQTLQNNLIIPSWNTFVGKIREIYELCKDIKDGKIADYIPQIAKFEPDMWGVSICTVDGQRVSFGNCKTAFCIQSVSKAFNYAIAASDLGADYVHKYVGQEPSGRLFNEICLDQNNKPHNPMVNSGAIIVTSLIKSSLNMAERYDYMLNRYRKISGGEYVGFNNATFLSERATADRNFAIAYYMKEMGCFPPETKCLTEALDFYFQLCSLEATTESAAVMAATLANGGVCPITKEKCIENRPCRDVLSLMYSCGMYDYSGQFSFHVGLPAKSGVSGIMTVVIPNLMGIALWSPPLDPMGNSCRGVAFCKELINRFNFHNYDSLAHSEKTKIDPRKGLSDIKSDQIVTLLFASKSGDLNTIRRLFMLGVDMDSYDYDKRTALHIAAAEGHTDLVRFLIRVAKVDFNPKDRWNRTPLDDAIQFNNTGCINVLKEAITKGGDISASAQSSSTEESDIEEPSYSFSRRKARFSISKSFLLNTSDIEYLFILHNNVVSVENYLIKEMGIFMDLEKDAYLDVTLIKNTVNNIINKRNKRENYCECYLHNTCPQGQKGLRGKDGEPGRPGKKGLSGIPGLPGKIPREFLIQYEGCIVCSMGPKGIQGQPGLVGRKGLPGIPGKKGEKGKDGLNGIHGEKGKRGISGAFGINGLKGYVGKNGINSIKGLQGIKGQRGKNGVPGIKGDKGINGKKGIEGITGNPGKQGFKGESGIPSAPGNIGNIGVPGIDGGYCPCKIKL